jgi:hypothetical protein
MGNVAWVWQSRPECFDFPNNKSTALSDKSPASGIDQVVQHSGFLALNGVSQAPELYGAGHLEQHRSSHDVDVSHHCPVHLQRERDGQECEEGEVDSAHLPELASMCGQALSESVQR